ncbi:sugar-binding transcriptional regulator [Xinfangfangia sp. D13-10-4-6]|uniref:sugar-binding transcriptional regulator n=1 Tax=Pseudogemmobacter hezensis TaxID=2737662 RepID=UPI001554B51B|nr:sugar-binding transcriptional regulator [Pseudogemmobacter hezensis]NPD17272.1 sugar-binding transcriptional regulator [Pseudogemmobacter hezensis]
MSMQRNAEEIIVEAAWAYYYEDRTQNEIAGMLGVSRSSVAMYLQQAREAGLVEVRLDPARFDTRTLAEALRSHYGLKEVWVAPGRTGSIERVAQLAARQLPDLLAPGDRLGVAWGQTVGTLAEYLVPKEIPDLKVLQLVGAMRTPYGFDTTNCAARIAAAFSGRVVNLHAPAILSTPELATALRQEELITRQLDALTEINKVVFAVGSVNDQSHIVLCGIATPAALEEYRKLGAVGIVLGRFVDRNGEHIEGPLDPRLIGLLPQAIRGREMSMLVSCGADKVLSIDAALRGGYANRLVTDLPTAEAVLAGPARAA